MIPKGLLASVALSFLLLASLPSIVPADPLASSTVRRSTWNEVTTAYAVSTGAITAVNVVMIGINGQTASSGRGSRLAGAIGLTTGTAQMLLGAANWNRDGNRGIFAVTSTAVGVLSMMVGAAAMSDRSPPVYVEAERGVALRPGVWVHESLGPMVGVGAAF